MNNDFDLLISNLKNNVNFAFSRFNDGEMIAIDQVGSVISRGDQMVTQELQQELKKSILHKQENYFIGIPCSKCYPKYHDLSLSLVGEYKFLTKATVLINDNWKRFLDQFPKSIEGRRIVWIGGDDQDIDNLNKIGITVDKKALIPRKNSWRYFNHILETFPQSFQKDDVVCISLGPTARILAQRWFESNPDKTFLDIGSTFDPYTRNVFHNYHLGWDETGFNLTKPCEECNIKYEN